jgi:hypothetical protein
VRYEFTRDQLAAYCEAKGLPGGGACTDPDMLRDAAEIQLGERRRLVAEQEAAEQDA